MENSLSVHSEIASNSLSLWWGMNILSTSYRRWTKYNPTM